MIILTVVTPCFNSGDTLKDTLDSALLLSEIFADHGYLLELILVDGGSSDSTLAIANSYRNKFNNFSIIKNINGGPYRAMNKGLKSAKGEYSFVLNSDDFISKPREYAEFIISSKLNNAAVLLSSITYFCRPSFSSKHLWKIQPVDVNLAIWKNKILSGMHYPHPGFIAKTDIYLSTLFDENYSLAADYKLMQSILLSLGSHENVSYSQIPYVAMAEGGLTTGFAAVFKGYLQLNAINKELGIKRSVFRRYLPKVYRRLKGIIHGIC